MLLALACLSCTDPLERHVSRVEVTIDADLDVRSATVRVLVDVETEAEPGSGWSSMPPRTFKADPDQIEWPIRYRLPEMSDREVGTVGLVATAHDQQGAVVARVQAIRSIARASDAGIRVHFDTHCFRQTSLCGEGRTCVGGDCVSARDEQPHPTGGDRETTGSTDSASMAAERDPSAGLAQAGAACEAGARACAARGSQSPLRCEGGVWKEEEGCAENERCDSNNGPTLGQCRAIARECANQKPLVPFCDGDIMRVCSDLVTSDVRPCADHMRCVQKPDRVQCECRPGFVDYEGVCMETDECTNNGGCDTLTMCQMVVGVRMCGPCPLGYAGTGAEGCQPLLSTLTSIAGVLSPALERDTRSYRLRVPLLVQRVELRASAAPGTRITYNNAEVAPGEAWKSPLLRVGEQIVDLELISQFGVSTRYEITIERTGAQEVYVKADHPGDADLFGYAIAISGDTLAVSAEAEDSAPGSDPENNALESSGAVYTFVRDANGWRADAFLKAEDAQEADFFGESVALEGDTLVVGATRANVLFASGSRNGVAYVYTRKNGVWTPQQRLSASNAAAGDMFGATASIAGSTLAIGALYGTAGGARNGAVYIFERQGAEFVERQILAPSVTNQGSGKYACDLQLDGDRLIVGDSGKELTRSHRGSAYIYVRRNGRFVEEQRLVSDTTPVDSQYGWAVALRGDRAVVGAPSPPQVRPGEVTAPGEVYVYERNADGWQQTAFLRSPSPAQSDYFGAGLALSDHVLAIGSNGERSSAAGFDGDRKSTGSMASGAVHLYANTEGRWAPSTYIKAAKPHEGDWLGWQVLLTGDQLVAAAPYERSSARGVNTSAPDPTASASGAVYVFH